MTLTQLFRRKPAPVLPSVKAIPLASITSDQRLKLIEWLNDPTTQFALSLIESTRPSVFVRAREAREDRILQLQGWESYRNTLLGLRYPPKQVRQIEEETYPEEN